MKANIEEYKPICDYVCDTASRVEHNEDTSPELRAAMNEFKEKSMELRRNFSDEDMENSITEIEQAADSALKVARSSDQYPQDLTSQIKDAHDKVRDFKEKYAS